MTGGEGEGGDVTDSFTAIKTFAVMGQRFTLDANKVQSVFPPATHQGDFSNCFPHIVFTSSTYPWQRLLSSSGSPQDAPQPPWLALLVFYEGEEPEVKQVTLSTFTTANLPETTSSEAILFYSF